MGRIIVVVLVLAMAGEGAASPPRHSYDRPLGRRLEAWSQRTGQERRRFRYEETSRPIRLDSSKAVQQLEALQTTLAQDPRARGAAVKRISAADAQFPVYRIDIPALVTSKKGRGRSKPTDRKPPLQVVITSWVHGDEQVGHLAAQRLVQYALSHPDWRDDKHLRFVVKIDPFGTRDTPDGVNLNRSMKAGKMNRVARDMARAVGRGKIHLGIDLHASDYRGSFLIQLADYGKLSGRIASAMSSYSLLDASPAAKTYQHPNEPAGLGYQFSAPGVATVPGVSPGPAGLGSVMEYLGRRARYAYTIEASQALPPERRVSDQVKLLRSAIDNVLRYGAR